MTTKEKVGEYLIAHGGMFDSGQELSEQLGISRSAIWKAVEGLRDDGLFIEARTNKGYRLSHNGQLSLAMLRKLLPSHEIHFHEDIDSTNHEAKALAAKGAPDGTLCISRRQSGGRGRLGRSFSSPHGGIYLSLVLRPHTSAEGALLTTSAAAVATALAIEESCHLHCQIKWVNDLYYQEKKVAGILTEGVFDLESGQLSAVVSGIGINFCTQERDFPPEIRQKAGSLFSGPSQVPDGVDQNLLVANLVRNFCSFSDHLEERAFLSEYRKRNLLQGRHVYLFQAGKPVGQGVVSGIDDNARLCVRMADGSLQILGTGEVSVRPVL